MQKLLLATAFLAIGTALAAQEFKVQLAAPWDGINVPDGQQCTLFGGNGATPPMQVSGLPEGASTIIVEYNDLSYQPLSENGGHGAIGYAVSGSSAELVSVPGLSTDLPDGIWVERAARAGGRYASDGYLPPCSGGAGNSYSADIIAFDAAGNRLGSLTVAIGRY